MFTIKLTIKLQGKFKMCIHENLSPDVQVSLRPPLKGHQ